MARKRTIKVDLAFNWKDNTTTYIRSKDGVVKTVPTDSIIIEQNR